MRQEAASKVQSAFSQLIHERMLAMQRTAQMYEAGLIELDRDPDHNVTARDCSFLSMLCEASGELDYSSFLITGLATGASFACNPNQAAFLSTSYFNGTHSIQGFLMWEAYASNVPDAQRKSWRERCMTEPPIYSPKGACPLPQDCQCGFRSTCRSWYQSQANVWGPPQPRMTDVFFDAYYDIPLVSLTFPVYNVSDPSQLVAVSAAEFYFQSMKAYLDALSGPKPMRTAVVLNDSNLTTIACSGGNSSNETDTNLAMNPDQAFLAMGAWLLSNRPGLVNHTTVMVNGIIWDVFPSNLETASYFVVVGMELLEIYGAIVSSKSEAVEQLKVLKVAHFAKLSESDNRTRSHMKATEEANLLQLEAMKEQVQEQLAQFRNTSMTALNASEVEGLARLEQLLVSQRLAVSNMLVLHLSVLTETIGWSVAVVIAVFLATLVVGVCGTLSITKGLQLIIQLMEDVAQMHVEALEVPKDSHVAEVQRIQLALDKLVGRLALYKSFMPAGLFLNQQQTDTVETTEKRMDGSYFRESGQRDSGFSTILSSSRQVVPMGSIESVPPECSVLSTTQTRIAKRNVVAMVVNITSFQAVLHSSIMNEGCLETLLNEYLSLAHGLVRQARGNIDSIIGDQLMITFNAHVRCSDASSVAARTALELQALLAARMSTRVQLQIGLAEGWTYVGCAGYEAFKTMVALGSPLKVASMLAHLTTASDTAVLADPALEERLRYSFRLRPVALVCLPQLGKFLPSLARNVPIFLVEGAKDVSPNEWMYEISPGTSLDEWTGIFHKVRAANSRAAAEELLEGYLAQHPADLHAKWMKSNFGQWRPKAGVPLCERPDSHSLHADPPKGRKTAGPFSDAYLDLPMV
eukprot:GGOE01004297.1.p1 GENE.GGOE01004297.1~~GGOE01004297.1.p1  ORF type:complete len:1006 (-),score=297.89 GGOE01004297.1:605-3193(-)